MVRRLVKEPTSWPIALYYCWLLTSWLFLCFPFLSAFLVVQPQQIIKFLTFTFSFCRRRRPSPLARSVTFYLSTWPIFGSLRQSVVPRNLVSSAIVQLVYIFSVSRARNYDDHCSRRGCLHYNLIYGSCWRWLRVCDSSPVQTSNVCVPAEFPYQIAPHVCLAQKSVFRGCRRCESPCPTASARFNDLLANNQPAVTRCYQSYAKAAYEKAIELHSTSRKNPNTFPKRPKRPWIPIIYPFNECPLLTPHFMTFMIIILWENPQLP